MKKQPSFKRKLLCVATATAIEMMAASSAQAVCTGSAASPGLSTSTTASSILCNGSENTGDLTITSSATDYRDSTNAGSTSWINNKTTTILQFDGNGRTLTVDPGAIIENYRNVNAGRYAVSMGASTQAAKNSTWFGATDVGGFTISTGVQANSSTTVVSNYTPASGSNLASTTLRINSGLTTTLYPGKYLVLGAWDTDQADFDAYGNNKVFKITAVGNGTVTIEGTLPDGTYGTDTAGGLPVRFTVVDNYGVRAAGSTLYHNIVKNHGTIASRVQQSEITSPTVAANAAAPYNSTIKGLTTSALGDYYVENTKLASADPRPVIRVTHAGIGAAYAVEEGGAVASLVLKNEGDIIAERLPTITITKLGDGNTLNAPQAKASLLVGGGDAYANINATSVGLVNAVNGQEEAQVFTLNNMAGGLVQTKGDYTGTLYLRAGESILNNSGTIEHLSSAGDYGKGWAIGMGSQNAWIRQLTVNNNATGVIHGDIVAAGLEALRYYTLSTVGANYNVDGSSNSLTLGTASAIAEGQNRRLFNAYYQGQQNLDLVNNGKIQGKMWLGNGQLDITNNYHLIGDIEVEQRDVTTASAIPTAASTDTILTDTDDGAFKVTNNTKTSGGVFVVRGDKKFTFENDDDGIFKGNIKIISASSTYMGTYKEGSATKDIAGRDSSANGYSPNTTKTVSSDNLITNSGIFDGNIEVVGAANAKNEIRLDGDGFGRNANGAVSSSSGNITAANGLGNNILSLSGTGTLRGNVDFGHLRVGYTYTDENNVSHTPTGEWSLANGKSYRFRGNVTIGAGDNTLDLGTNRVQVGGSVTIGDDATIKTTIGSDSVGSFIGATVAGTVDHGSTIVPTVSGRTIRAAEQFIIAENTVTDAVNRVPSVKNTPLVNWSAAFVGGNLVIKADQVKTAAEIGLSGNDAKVVDALLGSTSGAGGLLQGLDNVADIQKATHQLRPEVNGANHQASMNVTGKMFELVGSRLDQIHLASVAGRSGIATGDETRTADGTGVWMQAFGAKGSQDRRQSADGYNTQAYGFAAGADQLLDDDTRVGFVGSYGQSTVNGLSDVTGSRTSVDSYQVGLYGSTLLRKMYLNATLGLGYHDYTSNRKALDNIIKGDHNALQYTAKLEAGFPVNMKAVTLVPVASLAYSRLNEDSYKESGVGALSVKSRDTDSFRTGLGAKAMIPLIDNSVSAGLELRAIWNHEFADASIDTTARFVEGGASFTTKGVSLERDSANLGASLRVSGVLDGIKQSLNLNYDAEVKSQYLNQTASLQARFDF